MKKQSEIKSAKKRTLTPLDRRTEKNDYTTNIANDASLREAREAVMHDQFKSYQRPDENNSCD